MSTPTRAKPKTDCRRLDLGSAGLLMTPEEFDAIRRVDDRFRYEVIHGVLVVSRFLSIGEADPNEELSRFLPNYQADHPQGSALNLTLGEHYVYLPDSRRRPDRLIWAGLGRLPDLERDAPTIVVEFVSKSRRDWVRDYVEKRGEYLAHGVLEYWIIHRFRRIISVFRTPPAEPAEQVLDESGIYQTPLLPGFDLPLARLLTLADHWSKPRAPKPKGG